MSNSYKGCNITPVLAWLGNLEQKNRGDCRMLFMFMPWFARNFQIMHHRTVNCKIKMHFEKSNFWFRVGYTSLWKSKRDRARKKLYQKGCSCSTILIFHWLLNYLQNEVIQSTTKTQTYAFRRYSSSVL